jgi:hypothetical protein
MAEEMNTMGMNWGIVIFFLILFFIFAGGGNWFNRGNSQPNGADLMTMLQSEGAMGRVKNFDLQRQNDANTAELYKVMRNSQDATLAAVQNSTNQLAQQSRLQYDAQQGEKLFDLKLKALADQQTYEAKLAAKDATIERMTLAQQMSAQMAVMEKQIANITCNMLTKPQVTGVGAVCPNAGIINGLGIGSGINGCGTGITGIA